MSRRCFAVDASVAVKWLLPEDGHEAARSILERFQDEDLDLIAPCLLSPEVGNIHWKRVERSELKASVLLDSPFVSNAALRLAAAHRHPVYDCLYLALALEERCDLVTADQRFFRNMAPAFPCIRPLQS